MENQRAIALLIAVAAALLVVLAGRSCMKSIEKQNKEAENNNSAVYTSQTVTETVTSAVTVPSVTAETTVEYVTDFFGDIVGTAAPTEPYPDENSADTSTKSMLDEFWDSEHPDYLDPYGFAGGMQTPSVVEIEIG